MVQSATGRTIRVVAVDDSGAFLEGLRTWIASQPRLRLAGTARNGEDAMHVVERLEPDVVLMDAVMPVVDGYTATRRLKSLARPPRVVILTLHDSSAARTEARMAGADDFVGKAEIAERLIDVVQSLFQRG